MDKYEISVSVIVPVFNVEKYLSRCLDSIISQTLRNIEIIIVNDGSTDNSLEIAKLYSKSDKRIKIISKDNEGLSSARNIGIDNANGKYITFVDSDDWIDKYMIEKLYTKAEEHMCDLAMCLYSREYKHKSRPKILKLQDTIIYDEVSVRKLHRKIVGPFKDELKNPENNDALVTAWGKLYKSEIIKDRGVRFIDTSIIGTEDCLFNVYAFKHIKKAILLNRPYYKYWKENNNSLTSVYKKGLEEKWLTMYDYIKKFLDENDYESDFYLALNNRICLSTLGLGLNECSKLNNISSYKKIKNLKNILENKVISNAFKSLEFKYFPIHWKIFYMCNKYKISIGSYLLLNSIEFLRTRI